MALSQESLQDVIEAHGDLVASYDHIIRSGATKAKNRTRVFKPLIMYFVKAHVRRQYEHLHKLYAAEVISHGSMNSNQVEELRKRSSIIKDYYETLPSLRKYFGILSYLITAAGFFNLNLPWLFGLMGDAGFAIGLFLVTSAALMTFGIVLLFVVEIAFNSKRSLFSYPSQAEKYWQGTFVLPFVWSKKYQPKKPGRFTSIYNIEDRLYGALGAKKPKEIPLDVSVNIATGSFATIMVFMLSWQTIVNFIQSDGAMFQGIGFPIIVPMIYIIGFIVKPLIKYRRRIANESV